MEAAKTICRTGCSGKGCLVFVLDPTSPLKSLLLYPCSIALAAEEKKDTNDSIPHEGSVKHSLTPASQHGGTTGDTRQGLTLLTVETEANGSTNEEGSLVGRFVGLFMPVQDILILPWLLWSAQNKIFFIPVHYFNQCPHRPATSGSCAWHFGHLSLNVCLREQLHEKKFLLSKSFSSLSLSPLWCQLYSRDIERNIVPDSAGRDFAQSKVRQFCKLEWPRHKPVSMVWRCSKTSACQTGDWRTYGERN
jgi:hypothetical protein